MPMIAISGRCRFGGFNAATVASRSACAIGGGAVTDGAGGSDHSQPPPIMRRIATATRALHNRRCDVIVPDSMLALLQLSLPPSYPAVNDANPAKTVMEHDGAVGRAKERQR